MLQRQTANLIKIAAVITSVPRGVVALMGSEGLVVPSEWRGWWIILSALSAVGMAIVEGIAFAYVLSAWRNCRQANQGRVLVILAAASAVLFVTILAPSISANVRGKTLGEWMGSDTLLTVWSYVVAASTISIVASVGYADKAQASAPYPVASAPRSAPQDAEHIIVSKPDAPALPAGTPAYARMCEKCGASFGKPGAYAAHMRWKHPAHAEVES